MLDSNRILLIGRNLGHRAETLKRDRNIHLVAIELDHSALAQSHAFFDQLLPWNLDEPLPIASDDSFDAILCDLGLLESIKRPLVLLRQLRDTLNPSGRLLRGAEGE
jgi:SAM-dependent methyltransferase